MGVFGVWCGKCAKYLTFGTFTTPAVNALTKFYLFNNSFFEAFYEQFKSY